MILWTEQINQAHYQDLLQIAKQSRLAHQGLRSCQENQTIYHRVVFWLGTRLSIVGEKLQKHFKGNQAYQPHRNAKSIR